MTVDTACSSSLVALHLAVPGAAVRRVRAGPGRRRDRAWRPRRVHRSSPGSAGWPRTAGARRSPRRPTAPAGPRAPACWSSNGCRTRAATGTRCSRWSPAARSTRTARRNGLTAPNGPSQQRVIRAALASAGLSRGRRGRGRGARHRHRARRPDRGAGADRHLRAGPAGGPAAVARLGQVQHRPHPGRRRRGRRDQDGAWRCGTALPPTLHADEPSPHVDWSAGAVRLLTEAVPGRRTGGRAGPGSRRSASAAPTLT